MKVSNAPICVLGMHRSGTSMVTRVLYALGVELGGAERIDSQTSDNPEGYWENWHFVDINDAILEHFGGTWVNPPELPENWQHSSELDVYRLRAAGALTQFGNRGPIAFKDPRTMLTLPFWQTVFPELRYLLCIRNPFEVATSFTQRQDYGLHFAESAELWAEYHTRCLEHASLSQIIVSDNLSFAHDPEAEVRRLNDLFGLGATEDQIQEAFATVRQDLFRSAAPRFAVEMHAVPRDAQQLYWSLTEHAGPVYEAALANLDLSDQVTRNAFSRLHVQNLNLRSQNLVWEDKFGSVVSEALEVQERNSCEHEGHLAEITELSSNLQQLNGALRDSEIANHHLIHRIWGLERDYGLYTVSTQEQLARLTHDLAAIQGSMSWRLGSKLVGLFNRVAAPGSLVRRAGAKIYRQFRPLPPQPEIIPERVDELKPISLAGLSFVSSEAPVVSIIIPVHNQWSYTSRCLVSIAAYVPSDIRAEIIVVNDGSSDETSDKLAEAQGIRTVRNPVAQGFIRACNLGASLAQGELVLFLNNDTEVKPGWLESLLATAMEPDVAIVGSKLVYPNGTLQEAGGIVYNDGSGSNYGRNQDPEDPKYNFVRDVDYCSGASILVKKDFFDKVGGFDELYLPAYYEDTDLCMKARAAGLRVVYQPKSVVIHYEGVTSGTDLTSGTKKYQVINKEKFVERWQEELKAHCPALGYCALDIAARRLIAKPTILFCDVVVPRYDCDSGSLRLYRILNLLKELGYGIIFYSMNYKSVEPYKSKLEEMGIQVVLGSEDEEADRHTVRTWLALSDMVFVSRPETMARVLPVLVQEGTRRIVYDTVDIHYIRLRRQAELGISKPGESDWFDVRVDELRYCRVADVTLTVTETDKQHLELQGISHVAVVPNVQELPSEVRPGYEDREGILFIGMYTHAPNVDAVVWFVREIMPLIWAVKPGLKVTLLGSFPTDEVYALQSDRVEVTGYIEDVEPYFLTHRVFVAPLRYGAGMKGKITQSLYYQLPVVTTSIGAEGMGLVDHENAVVSDLAPDFAEAVLELYENRSLWEHIASNCSEALLPQSPGVIKETLKNVVEGLMRDPKLAD